MKEVSPMDFSPTDSSPKTFLRTHNSPNGHFPKSHFFFFYLNLFYSCYTKVAEANEFQQKSINTNNKLNAVVKRTYLQIKHPQSIFPRFLTLVLYSKTELMDLFKQEDCPIQENLENEKF